MCAIVYGCLSYFSNRINTKPSKEFQALQLVSQKNYAQAYLALSQETTFISSTLQEQIIKDFERSNDYVLPPQKTVIENFVKAGGEPGIMPAILGVKGIYLEAAFAEVNRVYGSMDRYIAYELKVDAAKQKAIRDAFLEKK